MAMQYPLLFPYAEDGYRIDIPFRANGRRSMKRNYISMREYYAYRIHNREVEGETLLRGGWLFQQFIVDVYTCIEESNLNWIRRNQKKLRVELYRGFRDAIVGGDTTPASTGRRFVFPSIFTGGPRYMMQNCQDAMAIC